MPIYLLGSRTPSVEVPNQTLSVAITGSVDEAELYVAAGAGQQVVRVSAHHVCIPALAAEVTVGVKPVGADAFSHNTVIHLLIGPDSPGELDPVQVSFDPVNVSGCGAMALGVLTPRGGRIEVSARAIADVPLSRLASMARTAARRRAGNRMSAPRGSLLIGVDTSASMSGAFADGSVSAAIDLLVGVADATGIREITATLVGARGVPVDAPAAELAQAVAGKPMRWSAGARWSELPDAQRTIVVTDAVSSSLSQAHSMLCISDDDRLRAVVPLLAPPPPDVRAEQNLADNPALIDDMAADLLSILN